MNVQFKKVFVIFSACLSAFFSIFFFLCDSLSLTFKNGTQLFNIVNFFSRHKIYGILFSFFLIIIGYVSLFAKNPLSTSMKSGVKQTSDEKLMKIILLFSLSIFIFVSFLFLIF